MSDSWENHEQGLCIVVFTFNTAHVETVFGQCSLKTQCTVRYDRLEIVLILQGKRREGVFIFDSSQNTRNLAPAFSLDKSGLDIIQAADVHMVHIVEATGALWSLLHYFTFLNACTYFS